MGPASQSSRGPVSGSRLDGSAVVYPDGTQVWYRNGLRHRGDGPAVVYPGGAQFWYVDNEYVAEQAPGGSAWTPPGWSVDENGAPRWSVDDDGVPHRAAD